MTRSADTLDRVTVIGATLSIAIGIAAFVWLIVYAVGGVH